MGFGQSELSGNSKTSGLTLLQFDIEDRDYYLLVKQLQILHPDNTDLKQHILRVGISPYVEKFEGLHSWLILEWQSNDLVYNSNQSCLTPFLRLFYRNLLFEIGQSFNGMTRFNYITHF